MKNNQITYPQTDRLSYLWLVVGTLIGFFWRMPLVWWLAPIFLLRFMRTQKVGRGFLLVWLSTFITAGVSMYGMMNALMPTPLPIYLVSMAVTALLIGGVPFLVDRLLAPRLGGFTATLLFPLIVTIVDYASARANPLGSIGAQAYMQIHHAALMQLLAITGMWGIVFLVNWLGPVVNWAWERKFEWQAIRRNALLYVGIMLAVFIYGGIRLVYAPDAPGTVRVHGITAVDMRTDMLPKLREAQGQSWQAYRDLSADIQAKYLEGTRREAQAGAQIVHWPEMAVMLAHEDEAGFIAQAQQIAAEEGIYIVMPYGVDYQDGSQWENKLIIVDPSGAVALEHYKYGGQSVEGFKGGDAVLRTIETPYGVISAIICNDTNHEEIVAQAGKNGTTILFAPSMEFRAVDPIHAHMATARAIENGVTLVRQADNGLSIVVDPYGRVVSQMDHFNNTEWVMVTAVPTQSTTTLYPYIGDLFAWLAIAGFVVLVVVGFVRGRKAKQAVAPVYS